MARGPIWVPLAFAAGTTVLSLPMFNLPAAAWREEIGLEPSKVTAIGLVLTMTLNSVMTLLTYYIGRAVNWLYQIYYNLSPPDTKR